MAVDISLIDRLMEPVGRCLTRDVAQRIVALRADSDLQARVEILADKANAGTFNHAERSEYEQYVHFAQFVTLLQVKASDLLDSPGVA